MGAPYIRPFATFKVRLQTHYTYRHICKHIDYKHNDLKYISLRINVDGELGN